MWYTGTTPTTTADTTLFTLGLLRLSQEEVIIGSLSTLLSVPLILLIVTLFKYVRPLSLRRNRIVETLQASSSSLPAERTPPAGKEDQTTAKAKKRRFQLPAICLPLAWLLCLAVMGLSMFLVWAYGISWGNDRVHQWLTSLLVSCCVSLLILEPAKVRRSFFKTYDSLTNVPSYSMPVSRVVDLVVIRKLSPHWWIALRFYTVCNMCCGFLFVLS
jgi:hypothetical protein